MCYQTQLGLAPFSSPVPPCVSFTEIYPSLYASLFFSCMDADKHTHTHTHTQTHTCTHTHIHILALTHSRNVFISSSLSRALCVYVSLSLSLSLGESEWRLSGKRNTGVVVHTNRVSSGEMQGLWGDRRYFIEVLPVKPLDSPFPDLPGEQREA